MQRDYVCWSPPKAEYGPRARAAGGQWWFAGGSCSPDPVGSVRTRLRCNSQARAQNRSRVGLDFLLWAHINSCFSWTSRSVSLLRDSPGSGVMKAPLAFGARCHENWVRSAWRARCLSEEPKFVTLVSSREKMERREISSDRWK